mgnify:FL=1
MAENTVIDGNDDVAALKQLKKKPWIAWPTVLLQLSSQIAILSAWYCCLFHDMPLWVGCSINIIAYYFLFTPAHDAMHRSISSKSWVNDLTLFSLMLTYVPGNTGKFLGLMHMQHHRFANDTLDPDHQLVANPLNIFFLWFFWDFRYLYIYFKNQQHYPKYNLVRMFTELILGFSIVGGAAFFFPTEILILWVIPTRIMVWLVCLVFMYLPHIPHDVTHKNDPYRATSMRFGWEWLLTPLMMYQNYHLTHHLYPTIPFYRYKKAWLARKTFHESKNPAIVSAFRLNPKPSTEMGK